MMQSPGLGQIPGRDRPSCSGRLISEASSLLSKVGKRVHRNFTPADFEVAVFGGGVARSPYPGDGLASVDLLALLNQQF
jgi:hypothetical protein